MNTVYREAALKRAFGDWRFTDHGLKPGSRKQATNYEGGKVFFGWFEILIFKLGMMMNVVAIVGSPRKGRATDRLVDEAIKGVKVKQPDCKVKKINLVDYNIQYCRNCLVCRDRETDAAYSECVIEDDMGRIYEELLGSDALILATPVHAGYPTALMMMFLERIIWPFGKPEKRYLNISGCPLPRSDKKRRAIIIVTSGIIPPLYRRFCDWATGCIKGIVRDSLKAKTVGNMYAGDLEHRGVDYYCDKAKRLGEKLVGGDEKMGLT